MPSSHEAYWRHANLYLSIAEAANDTFNSAAMQGKGLLTFDNNAEQIDSALMWLINLSPTDQTDLLLIQLVDAVSSIGMLRYSIKEKLIPFQEHQVAASQRLSIKEFEADAIDGLGIFYAHLGYLPKAIEYFKKAREIAYQTEDQELIKDIQDHIELAREQLEDKGILQLSKIPVILGLIPTWLKLKQAQARQDRFLEVTLLNRLGAIYLTLTKWDVAIRYFQHAILISQQLSYRLGQLEASMGLLQAKMSKEANFMATPVDDLKDLSGEFEWGVDIQVLETFIEIAPAIKDLETIALYLEEKNDPMANEIYQQLDQIMLRTEEIITAVTQDTQSKLEVFVTGLQGIKENLTHAVEIKNVFLANQSKSG